MKIDKNTIEDFIVIDVTEQKVNVNYQERNSKIFEKSNKNKSDNELELALLDTAFSDTLSAARNWQKYFIIQSHLFNEEELACCLDLAEHFIKNKQSLALKLIVINRLEVYKNLNYEIKAITKLTKEIFKNLDQQLNIDDSSNSYEFKFLQICFENIFYRDLKDFEFSALSRVTFSEEEQKLIRKEVFNAMIDILNRYQNSYCVNLTQINNQRFEFTIIETEKSSLDFNTHFNLKCFENEFSDYLRHNSLLLNSNELNSCEALAKIFIESNSKNNNELVYSLLKEIKKRGEHLSSISCVIIQIFSKLDSKLKSKKHLSQEFSKLLINYKNVK